MFRFFFKIQDKNFIGTPIRKQYDSLVNLYSRLSEFHLSLFNGTWIPIGSLKAVGNHVQTGYQIGLKKMKMNYDVTIALKYLNSKNYYEFIKNDSLYSTNYFVGAYCGIEVGKDIWYSNGHELQIISGIGFDGFTVYEEKSNSNNTQQKKTSFNTNSYNFNFGLIYRFYITHSFYVGLKAKYNLVDYTLNKIISYQGDVIKFDLVLGTVNNVV